jgi:Flp pilus assembly protein TadG
VRWRDERGAAAVEFALLLPLIVIILFATTEFGINMAKWEDYESAAREGARYAAVRCQPRQVGDSTTGPCTKAMIVRAINQASSNPPVAESALTVTPADMDCSLPANRGNPIAVSWQQTFTFEVPFLSIGSRIRTIKGVFRCE